MKQRLLVSAIPVVLLSAFCASGTPPTISDLPDQTTLMNTPVGPIPFTIGDAETPPTSLSVIASSDNTTLVPFGNMAIGGSGSARSLTVQPANRQCGTARITVTVIDGNGTPTNDAFLLTVPCDVAGEIGCWSGWSSVPAGGFATDRALGASGYRDTQYLFAKRMSDGRAFFNTFVGSAWSGWTDVTPSDLTFTTDEALGTVSYGEHLYLFGKRTDNQHIYFNRYDGSAWNPSWTELPEVRATDSALATTSFRGNLYLFAKGGMGDGGIYSTRFNGSTWEFWFGVPGGVTTDFAPCVATLSGRMYLFVTRTGDHRIYFSSTPDGASWSSWSEVPPGGRTTDVALGAATLGRFLYLFAKGTGPDQRIYVNYTADGSSWCGWREVPMDGTTDVALGATELKGEVYLFSKFLDQGVYFNVGSEKRSFALVNIIPNDQSGETNQNSEASIGVWRDPGGTCEKALMSAFKNDRPYPYFGSSDGGRTWTTLTNLEHSDTTMEWSPSGTAYTALRNNVSIRTINVRSCEDPVGGTPFLDLPNSHYTSGFMGCGRDCGPDQPWLEVANVEGVDRLYVGFNDLNSPAGDRTASVWFSLDSGATWHSNVIERVNPGLGLDSPAVRPAAAKDGRTVYAMFLRFNASVAGGYRGDVVVVRDDNGGLNSFGNLGDSGEGTLVVHDVILPWGSTSRLGSQRIGTDCSIAVSPRDSRKVYVAYVEVVVATPRLRVHVSEDGGETFGPVAFSPTDPAALSALAVADNGTVGLLYTALNAVNNLETHFLQARGGSFLFLDLTDRILASFPDNTPRSRGSAFGPYIGDYQDLEAVGNVFYGGFCASNDPDPAHFPHGVRFQRNVLVGSGIKRNLDLTNAGTLVDLTGNPVPISIDPFYFYADAERPLLAIRPTGFLSHRIISWSEGRSLLPAARMFVPEATPLLSGQAQWAPLAGPIAETNGEFSVTVDVSSPSMFYRLRRQPSTNAQFTILTLAGRNGSIKPSGTSLKAANESLSLTATPDPNYAVDVWYLDGSIAQVGGNAFTLKGIQDEHTVTAAFTPTNELILTKIVQVPEGGDEAHEVFVGSNLTYVITVANIGINPATGVTISDELAQSVSYVSAISSQGFCMHMGNTVTCVLGALSRGASATITITVIPTIAGTLANTASVVGNESELDQTNNHDTATVTVEPGLIPP